MGTKATKSASVEKDSIHDHTVVFSSENHLCWISYRLDLFRCSMSSLRVLFSLSSWRLRK